jgi:hypothetical protein
VLIETGVALQPDNEAGPLTALLGVAGFKKVSIENFSGEIVPNGTNRAIANLVLMGQKP